MSNYFGSYKDSFFLAMPRSGAMKVSLTRTIASAISRIPVWQQRNKQRKALAKLDQRLRDDIGLSMEQVRDESDKPFWME